jgi:hypothetical protein
MRYYWLNLPGQGLGTQQEITRFPIHQHISTAGLWGSWLSSEYSHIIRVTSTSILLMAINRHHQKQWWLFTKNKEVSSDG